jgi:phosphotransferase family enzyme
VQSWGRSPLFETVPEEIRGWAAGSVPWRTEPLVYRSDLAQRLPHGLRMARPLGVYDLDDLSAAVWLEKVPAVAVEWDEQRFAHAAYLMGRFAASPRVVERADVGEHPFTIRTYLEGRLSHQVLPALRDAGVWRHPLVAGAFDPELHERLLRAADDAPAYVDELVALPRYASHGDSCPNNLLVVDGYDGFVLIDFGYLTLEPLGFDLGQLLVGDVQTGRIAASSMGWIEHTILPAYVEGVRAEGVDTTEHALRRAHALHLMLFTGLSTIPLEHLGEEPTPELHAVAAERAAIARFALDLLDATS